MRLDVRAGPAPRPRLSGSPGARVALGLLVGLCVTLSGSPAGAQTPAGTAPNPAPDPAPNPADARQGAPAAAGDPKTAEPSSDVSPDGSPPSGASGASAGPSEEPSAEPGAAAETAALGALIDAARFGPAPTVRAVSYADGRALDAASRVAVDGLVGQPATGEALDGLVRALARNDAPGLDLRRVPTDDAGLIDVLIVPEDRIRRVGRLRPTTAPVGTPDLDADRRLQRRIEGMVAPLALEEGHVFHPWFERRDAERVQRYFVEQGHPFARVDIRRFETPGIVDVTWRVAPGPKLAVGGVSVAGLPDPVDRPTLGTVGGRAVLPWVVADDVERLRGHVCRAGFPDARVAVETALGQRALYLSFVIERGPPVSVGRLDVDLPAGVSALPAAVLADLPVRADGPWCPDLARQATALIRERLEAAGRPDATVGWRVAALPGKPPTVALTLQVADAGAVRIGRVWFAGNRVTRVDLLRELVTVRPGDLYDPEAIDDSVQVLRRSALFRRVEARTVPGPDRGTRHLVFTVVEREPFSIDLGQQSLTLHNLDVADTTTDVRALRAGAALRGAGQRMVLYAQPRWQGLHLFDPYVLPVLGAEGRLDRRERDFGADIRETWYSLEGEAALRLFDDRLLLVPGLQYEVTFPEGVSSSAELPVADDETLFAAAGFRTSLRFERLDDERVPYLGVRFEGRLWRGLSWLGSDLDLTRWRGSVDVRLPLRRFEGDRHMVLGLAFSAADIARYNRRALAAHHRLTPKIRGYESLRFRHPLGQEVLELGGQTAFTAAVEVRLPMPYARRHALVPFFDAAALGDRGTDPLDALFAAPGLTYVYSFFDERLEGYLRVAFPLRTDVDLEYIGFGMDGSF